MRLHASVCPLLRAPEVTNGRGSAERWRPSPPAMAAGVTEQVGTRQEVLRYRVLPLGRQGGLRSCKAMTRVDDRLRRTAQTVWERCPNMTHTPQVDDPQG